MVKVDADVYHLDRLQLAWKSDYFEKLFTDDFHEKKCCLVELPVMDSDTFSTVVDIIYGKDLNLVLNNDNYVTLWMAMDYLQMRIDLKIYKNFIKDFVEKRPSLDAEIFKLCHYVAENRDFNYLAPVVYSCLSVHLAEIRKYSEFFSLSIDFVVGIISAEERVVSNVDHVNESSRICVEWIFHDVENRLRHAGKLVNAVRYRFQFPVRINEGDFGGRMSNEGGEITPDTILRYFIKMVVYVGDIEENCTGR